MLQVLFNKKKAFYPELLYITSIFLVNKGVEWSHAESFSEDVLYIDDSESADIKVSADFFMDFLAPGNLGKVPGNEQLNNLRERGDLFLCMMLMNSTQEFNAQTVDNLGRYRFQSSVQHNSGIILTNVVQEIFDSIFAKTKKLSSYRSAKKKTRVFLSHDVDNVNNAWLEDGYSAFKKMKWITMSKLIVNAILLRPDWLNMDKIMNIHCEYDLKSVFFWIVNKGKTEEGLANADYDINSKKIRDIMKLSSRNGFETGLHKSISPSTFKEETEKLGFVPSANRNHYLKFSLPGHFKAVEQSGIPLDCSLGFAEHYGFRNSYGQPFQPFDFENRKPFNFLEAPLHIMDRTFFNYLHIPTEEVHKLMIDFFEKNSEGCVLSVLWHNNFFNSVKYSGYLEEYRKLLSYFVETGIRSITPAEIISEFKIF